MSRLVFRLNCTRCGEFTEYHHEEETNHIVLCADCYKRHGTASTFAVKPGKSYSRDEAGELMESVP